MPQHAHPVDDARITVDESVFRNVAGHFASGVTVITTDDGERRYGTTASAVSSLSMDPPMMLVCLNRSSTTHDAVARSGRFAISILSVEQDLLARHFGRKGEDKFADVPWSAGPHGLPLLDGALATVECTVAETAVGGTHTVFLGTVVSAEARPGEPLAYYRGRFGALEQSTEAAVYAGVRSWVLTRRTPLGSALEVAGLAAELEADSAYVYNALVRLVTENLVERTVDGGFAPTPVTEALVRNLYGARATIETGVVDQYLARASDEELAAIAERAAALATAPTSTSAELDAFLEANLEFHCTIVGLAGSRQLVQHFRQLSIATVWRESYRSRMWQDREGHPFIPRIAEALVSRDTPAALELIRRQVDFVTATAIRMITEQGGAL
ncbi:flavin reductase [Leucobacter allii]|uniref:Flavin reductase n=1 Tax=Leucobacter allii TaxID=2932247 RepID=A0ABY4FLG5_9MICO|nr:flavin reductase [Leucobacter allii]UOQ57094.1 flavin reductase [Leucobacter allii]